MDKKRPPFFLIAPDSNELAEFSMLIKSCESAQQDGYFDTAELLCRIAIKDAVEKWGPYNWPEAIALISLSDLYFKTGRQDEGEISLLLSRRILGLD